MIPVERASLARPASEVAPQLLGKLLVTRRDDDVRIGRIVEVEAYEQHEEASHTFRGPTPRNLVMFGPPGHLYVYFSYGVHWCANVVCDEAGRGSAVLLRALAPVSGVEAMELARPAARRRHELCNGPGKLCAALGITGADNGADLLACAGDGVGLFDDGTAPPPSPGRSTRIGITKATALTWRWFVVGDVHVSRGRPVTAAPN